MEITTPKDYEANGRKRQRRSPRPCDACRRRKTRCVTNEGDASCIYCQLRNTACTFDKDPPERAATSASMQQNHSHGQNFRPSSQGIAASSGMGRLASESQAVMSVGSRLTNDVQPPGAESATAVLSSGTRTEVSPITPTLGLAPGRFSELYGLGSDMEPILMRHRPYNPTTHEFNLETHAIRRVLGNDDGQEYPLTFHIATDDNTPDEGASYAHVDSIEDCVKPHGPSLLDLFWRYVQPCYPIIAQEAFVQTYSRGYRNIPANLLGAIYLCSLRWWTYDPELSIRSAPDATLLRRILREVIPLSYHRPTLSSIQAVLLLLQCEPEDPLNPDHAYQWGITCQALAIGQCLGLHLDASNWSIPQWERSLRKRLSWALYMQDRWTALAYGRPVHIHEDDWTVQDLTSLDFSDADNACLGQDDERRSIATTGKMQFMQMVKLTQLLSTVLSAFYTARSNREQDTVVLYEKARPLLAALNAWYADIPSSLHMNITYQRKLCFHGYLHFSYYGAVMTLLRRLIRSTALPPRCYDGHVLADIRQCAVETAQNAVTFVTNLRPDHLEAFWYFTSPYLFSLLGSFTALLLVTSLSTEERNFWKETLNSYLWNLRMISKSFDPMQYAVNRLEGAILRDLEHILAVNLNEPAEDEDVCPVMTDYSNNVFEYTDFGDRNLPTTMGSEGAFDS